MAATDWTAQALNSTNYGTDPDSLNGKIMDDTVVTMDDTVYTLDNSAGNSPVTAPTTNWTAA